MTFAHFAPAWPANLLNLIISLSCIILKISYIPGIVIRLKVCLTGVCVCVPYYPRILTYWKGTHTHIYCEQYTGCTLAGNIDHSEGNPRNYICTHTHTNKQIESFINHSIQLGWQCRRPTLEVPRTIGFFIFGAKVLPLYSKENLKVCD